MRTRVKERATFKSSETDSDREGKTSCTSAQNFSATAGDPTVLRGTHVMISVPIELSLVTDFFSIVICLSNWLARIVGQKAFVLPPDLLRKYSSIRIART